MLLLMHDVVTQPYIYKGSPFYMYNFTSSTMKGQTNGTRDKINANYQNAPEHRIVDERPTVHIATGRHLAVFA